MIRHQYIDRETFAPITEELFLDRVIGFIYSRLREDAYFVFRLLVSGRTSAFMAFLNYEFFLSRRITGVARFVKACGIDCEECADPLDLLDTPRKIFERRIRYWECRPMAKGKEVILSPADARMLPGSLAHGSGLFLKNKFFDLDELLVKEQWIGAFRGADFAVFRLTPDRYHYNHMPVSGRVMDFYEVSGAYHSCNPSAIVALVTPYSKNKRVVTVLDTDVPGGTQAGLVAMIEVVALMIGRVDQRYSEEGYVNPGPIEAGMFLRKGCPKSLYAPGSSTDVLLFEEGRMMFDEELIANLRSPFASSRFSHAFERPLVETNVLVRSSIGQAVPVRAKRVIGSRGSQLKE
jgi:phosphatidylserine decarboxylase